MLCLRVITYATCLALTLLLVFLHFYSSDSEDFCWQFRSEGACIDTDNSFDPPAFEFFVGTRECVWMGSHRPPCILSNPKIDIHTIVLIAFLGNLITSSFFCFFLKTAICNANPFIFQVLDVCPS